MCLQLCICGAVTVLSLFGVWLHDDGGGGGVADYFNGLVCLARSRIAPLSTYHYLRCYLSW